MKNEYEQPHLHEHVATKTTTASELALDDFL